MQKEFYETTILEKRAIEIANDLSVKLEEEWNRVSEDSIEIKYKFNYSQLNEKGKFQHKAFLRALELLKDNKWKVKAKPLHVLSNVSESFYIVYLSGIYSSHTERYEGLIIKQEYSPTA